VPSNTNRQRNSLSSATRKHRSADISCENFTISSKVTEGRERQNIERNDLWPRRKCRKKLCYKCCSVCGNPSARRAWILARVDNPTQVSTLPNASSKKSNAESNRPAQNSSKPIIVILIGSAVKGVGSRIKGHAKLEGKQLRKRHRRYTTAGITNEYHTSQTCSHCLSPIIHPKTTKIWTESPRCWQIRGLLCV
jgi:hypothetical protein